LPAAARDLYVSTLFRGRRSFVEASCDAWYVLSARHGLVAPDEILDPYEATLNGMSRSGKRVWAEGVLEQIDALQLDLPHVVFEIHAGAEYREFGLIDGLARRGAAVEVPAAHLGQGKQLAFYGPQGTQRS
jgi:hypothetical protein